MLKNTIVSCSYVLMLASVSYSQSLSSDLTNRMTPTKMQGSRNTCSAFASTAVMEFLIKDQTGVELDLSENFAYWNAKKNHLENDFLRDNYQNSDGHAGYLALEAYKYGSMLESDWPYFQNLADIAGDPRCDMNKPITECFTGFIPASAPRLKYRAEAIYVTFADLPRFLHEEQKPVVVNIMWYMDAVDREGNLRMPTAQEIRGNNKGGHVITIVGYNATTDRYIFKNSWSQNWGKNGFGTMPRSYLLEHFEVKPWMANINEHSADVQDMLRKGSMGTSANLIIDIQ